MELNNKDFNVGKPRKYEKIGKGIVKINERYMEYFGPVSSPFFLSDMVVKRKLDCLKNNEIFLCFNFLNRMFGFTISE